MTSHPFTSTNPLTFFCNNPNRAFHESGDGGWSNLSHVTALSHSHIHPPTCCILQTHPVLNVNITHNYANCQRSPFFLSVIPYIDDRCVLTRSSIRSSYRLQYWTMQTNTTHSDNHTHARAQENRHRRLVHAETC